MSGDCKVNYWLPFSSIGDHIATYIKETPLSTKITSLAHAIFFGGYFYLGTRLLFASSSIIVPISTILTASIGIFLITLVVEAIACGYWKKKFSKI